MAPRLTRVVSGCPRTADLPAPVSATVPWPFSPDLKQVYPTCFHVAEESDTICVENEGQVPGTVAGVERRGVARGGRGAEGEADLERGEGEAGSEIGGAGVGFKERARGREREGGRARETGGGGGLERRERSGEKPQGCGVVVSPSDIKDLLKDDARTKGK